MADLSRPFPRSQCQNAIGRPVVGNYASDHFTLLFVQTLRRVRDPPPTAGSVGSEPYE